ncbi:MAG: alpha/beta hydrolase family protein [Bacteroidales bacterium]
MQRFTFLLVLLVLGFFSAVQAQERRSLSHDDYDHWRTLTGAELSRNGQLSLFLLNPQRQDGHLVIRNLSTGEEHTIERGAKASFAPDNSFVVFHIEPPRAVVRQARVAKKKREEMPKDTLGIWVSATGQILHFADVISYQLPKEPSPWVAFAIDFSRVIEEVQEVEQTPEDTLVPPPVVVEEQEEEPKTEPEREKLKQLIVKNPATGVMHVFDYVEQYRLSENGQSVIFLQEKTHKDDALKVKHLWYFHIPTATRHALTSGEGDFKQLSVSKNGETFAWLFSSDTTKVKVYDLHVHQTGRRPRTWVVNAETAGMPEGFAVSEHRSPSFSDNHQRVFFGIAPRPEEEPKDTLLDDEKYRLDIWHWQDPLLQSQQKAQLQREQRRSFETVLHLTSGRMVPLADENMPEIARDRYGNARWFMGVSNVPYLMEISWLGSAPRDIFAVDATTGERQQVLERAEGIVQLSVHGDYILYFVPGQNLWRVYSMKDKVHRDLNAGLDVAFYDEDNDVPAHARPYGIAGWAENDAFVLLYDRYDIWRFDPTGRTRPVNVTSAHGRSNTIRYRYQNLDPDEYHIPQTLYLSAFNPRTKRDGYAMLNLQSLQLTSLLEEDASFTQLQKARDAQVFQWRRSTFTEFADLWTTHGDFRSASRISDANPQQQEYLWGSVQLVEWLDFNNDTLQGLLYLPENLDPDQKYPLIVYFYERSSDRLHSHSIPSPSRSIINPAFCTSNGYIVFVPDITYKEGFPGQGAYNAIVSGTKAMVERYPFINRERMGLQGQSWGGYQIAYLITQTNMFRAAMAGAPVSNMVSAYGGIRWTTGMSRQFQYEKTQSRIGGTLWERPIRYIENSPIFFVDKIETPLLMMHNDNDGAVPWYQGIELFVAMRRLGKPVWMLNYNGEEHNLMEWPNRVDLSIRMYQFFDHYLKDEPAPRWLQQGRPFIDRNRTDAYELME